MKLFTYTLLMIGMVLLFEFAGIPTGAGFILDKVGLSTTTVAVNNSSFYIIAIGVLAGAVGVGIAVGFFTKSFSPELILIPFITTILAGFIAAFVSIIQYTIDFSGAGFSWVSMIVICILGTLTVGYVVTILEFFRGTA